MKTIVITGGAGFLGSHLCDELVKKNNVICVDNLFTGSKDNIKHLKENKNFKKRTINVEVSTNVRRESQPKRKSRNKFGKSDSSHRKQGRKSDWSKRKRK